MGVSVTQEHRSRPGTSFIIANLPGWIFIEGVTRRQYSLLVSVTFYDKLRPGCYRLSVTIEISQRHVKDNDKEPKSVLQRTGILSADTPLSRSKIPQDVIWVVVMLFYRRRFDRYFVGRPNPQATLQFSSGSGLELSGNGLSDGKFV